MAAGKETRSDRREREREREGVVLLMNICIRCVDFLANLINQYCKAVCFKQKKKKQIKVLFSLSGDIKRLIKNSFVHVVVLFASGGGKKGKLLNFNTRDDLCN